MKKINYFGILKDAWKTTWKNKYLWWFGLLITLTSGSGMFSSRWGKGEDGKEAQKFLEFMSAHQTEVIILAIVGALLVVVFLILGIIARGALLKSVQKNLAGQTSSFKEGFKDGKKYFWKIFLIGLFTSLFAAAFALVFSIPIVFLFASKSYILGGITVFLAIIVLVPAMFLLFFTKIYAQFYAVLSDLSVGDALENGYYLILKNIWSSILMVLIFFLVCIVLFIIFLLSFILVIIPFAIIGGILFAVFETAGAIIAAVLAGLVMMPLFLLVSSILKVFTETAWILFFKEIAKSEEKEAIAEIESEVKASPTITGVPA